MTAWLLSRGLAATPGVECNQADDHDGACDERGNQGTAVGPNPRSCGRPCLGRIGPTMIAWPQRRSLRFVHLPSPDPPSEIRRTLSLVCGGSQSSALGWPVM